MRRFSRGNAAKMTPQKLAVYGRSSAVRDPFPPRTNTTPYSVSSVLCATHPPPTVRFTTARRPPVVDCYRASEARHRQRGKPTERVREEKPMAIVLDACRSSRRSKAPVINSKISHLVGGPRVAGRIPLFTPPLRINRIFCW